MAVSISMSVGGVKVLQILDKFSTDRSLINAAGNSEWISNEQHIEATALKLARLPRFSTEAPEFNPPDNKGDYSKQIAHITDVSNLVVGKLVEVKLEDNCRHVNVPVEIRLIPKSIKADSLVEISKANSIDRTMAGRYHAWRSGELKGIMDYLFCLDIIDADRKALMADTTGTLSNLRTKRSKGILAALMSGAASPNTISTMVIMSSTTAADIEFSLLGKLSNAHVRKKYFDNNATMMLVVVDTRREIFTLYQRGVADAGTYTFNDIKNNDKKANGVDIKSVLEAYRLGNAPTL